MYIASAPTVEFESRNVYWWCARGRMRAQECILLVCLVSNVSSEMYIAGTPAVGFESRDVYFQCAHSTMQVSGCISLVRPP